MTTIYLKGGLGNQMFQYAYGRKIMLVDKKEVVFDVSFFYGEKAKIDTERPFLLGKFNIDPSVKLEKTTESFLQKIAKKTVSKITNNYGFFQSEKYFKEIEDTIRQEFTLKEPFGYLAKKVLEKITVWQNPVSIHIRRGDYAQDKATNTHHGLLPMSYYEKALEYLKNKEQNVTYFVFSDDIEWAKNNLKLDSETVFVSNPEILEYEEMILMSKCSHHIIANSSFSWWGAWLNPKEEKIVMAPKQWLAKKTANELEILPKSWIQI